MWKEWFLLALAFSQRSCLSAAVDSVVVHEQIDKLSSACIKTAHLRHQGLLLGVIRALWKKSLRLSSVLMEWLRTPDQTDWVPLDLSVHHIGCAAVIFFFWMPIVKLLLKRATIVWKSSVQSGQLSRSLAFSALLADSPFSCRQQELLVRAAALRCAGGSVLAKVVGGGGVTVQPHLLCLGREISLALCSFPVENESGTRVDCT